MLNTQVDTALNAGSDIWTVPNIPEQAIALGKEDIRQTHQTSKSVVNSELFKVLDRFESHSLHDLNNAKLMDRVDVKFMLPTSLLPDLLEQMRCHYSVLEINDSRISRYYNEYFDTPQMNFYQDHHNGKLNRFKVRQRTYVDTDTKFLEVKFKNNQKRTIKTRVPGSDDLTNNQDCQSFIAEKLGLSLDELTLCHQSGYQRIALANEESAERLTLDFNLWYQLDKNSKKIELSGFFIAELKQSKRSKRSPFYQLMSKHNIFPASFSKYCIGCALLYAPDSVQYSNQDAKQEMKQQASDSANSQLTANKLVTKNLKTNHFKSTLNQIKQFERMNLAY